MVSNYRIVCLSSALLLCGSIIAGSALAADKVKPTQKVTAEDAFRQGVAAMSAGQIEVAVERFERCTELKIDLKECWYNLGLAWGRKRKFVLEAKAYQKAIELDPTYGRAHFNLALVLEDLGKAAESIVHYDKAIAAEPNAQDARLNRAMLLLRLKRVDDAVRGFRSATKIKESNPEAWFDLAQALEIQADPLDEPKRTKGLREAVKTYYRCLQHASKHHRAWYNIGVVHHRLKDSASEIAAYKKALEIKGGYTPALYNLAFALRDSGDKTTAKQAFQRYLAVAGKRKSEKRFIRAAKAALSRL